MFMKEDRQDESSVVQALNQIKEAVVEQTKVYSAVLESIKVL